MARYSKKTDLTQGFGRNQIDYTRNNLQDLLTAATKLVDNHFVKKEKLMMNGIEQVVTKAGNFTSEEQYQDAFKTLDSLSSQMTFKDPTTNSMIDNFEDILSAHHQNFTADNALQDMFLDTKSKLIDLNQVESSEQLPEILASVEELLKQYRPNASSNVNKMGEKLHQDVLDAIYVADLLMRKDKNLDDPNWNMEGEGYNTSASLYLAGDFTGAKRAMVRGGKQEHQAVWRAAGDKYGQGLKKMINTQKTFMDGMKTADKDNKDEVEYNGMFRHVRYIPTVGAQNLNQYNLADAEQNVYSILHTVMNEQTMNQGKGFKNSDVLFHQKLYEYFAPSEGMVDGEGNLIIGGGVSMYEFIKSAMVTPDMGGAYTKEDIEWINREDMINFLADNIQFVPDKVGRGDFGLPGWDEPFDGINKLGAEYFLDMIQLNLDIYQSKQNIDKLDVAMLGDRVFGISGDY